MATREELWVLAQALAVLELLWTLSADFRACSVEAACARPHFPF